MKCHESDEVWFLNSFAQAGNASVSFVMSARLYVRMYELGSHRTDFREIWYWALLRKPVEKVQLWLKSGNNIRRED